MNDWFGILTVALVLAAGIVCFLLKVPDAGYALVGAAVGLISPSPIRAIIPSRVQE